MNNQAENTIRTTKDFWFACVDIDVLRDKELSQSARFIFAVLCTFITVNNRNCWPSNDSVAEAAGVSKSTVKRAYQELEARGIIARSIRFKDDSSQTSSYTRIVGHNAACYEGGAPVNPSQSTDDPPPSSPVNHKGNQVKDIKDSLTWEVELPDFSDKAKDSGNSSTTYTPNQEVLDSNPKEVCTPDDVPEIFKQTAKYFLYETKRSGLTWDEVSAFRTLAADHTPARVQKEIDTACARFRRHGKALSTLTISYIAGALQHQQSRRKRKDKAKPDTTMTGITSADIERLEKDLTPEEIARIEKFEREGGIL